MGMPARAAVVRALLVAVAALLLPALAAGPLAPGSAAQPTLVLCGAQRLRGGAATGCCAPLGAARPACRRPGPRPPGPRPQAPGRRRASAAPVMRLRGGSGGQRPWEREQSMPDYYAMLGVAPGAGDQELRKAHKKMMLLYHPDKNAGSKVAQERFVRIQVSACPSRAFARGRRACAVLLEDAARRARAMPCVLTLAVVGRAGRVLGALASGSPQRI